MELKVGQDWRDTWSSVDRVISSVGTRPCVQRSPCRSHVGIDDETNGFCAEAFEGGERLVFVRSAVTAEERPVPAVDGTPLSVGDKLKNTSNGLYYEVMSIGAEVEFRYGFSKGATKWPADKVNDRVFIRHGSTPEAPKPVEVFNVPSGASVRSLKTVECGFAFVSSGRHLKCTRVRGHYGDLHVHVAASPETPAPSPAKPKPPVRHTYASLMALERANDGVPPPKTCRLCHASGPVNEIGHCLGCHGDIDDKFTGAWGTTVAPPKPEPWRPNLDHDFDMPWIDEYGGGR